MSQADARKRLAQLYYSGITSPTALHDQTGMSRSTIYRTIDKIQSEESLENSDRTGRSPAITDPNDKRRLVQIALKHPLDSSNQINEIFQERGGPVVSDRTVRRYLHESGIFKLVPKPSIALTDAHMRKRVDFSDAHWMDDFSRSFFTDEASFSLERHRLPQWSAGKPRQIPTSKFPKTVTIWGGISEMGPTTIAIKNVTINQYNYQEILNDCLLPNAEAYYGEDWHFQQDNAPPHTARSTQAWLHDNVPSVLEWPPNSPDLSPIENIWPLVKNGVEKENAKNLPEFESKIKEIWEKIELPILSHLIESVPNRLKACRDLRGREVKLKLLKP